MFPGPTSYGHSISLSRGFWRTEAFFGAKLCPSIPCSQGSDWDVWKCLGSPWRQAHIDFPECVYRWGKGGGCVDLSVGPSCLAPQLFPAVPPSEPSYRSLLLINKGSMLLTFNLAPQSSSDISLRPSSGLVAPGAHQIFLICTYPKGNAWKQHIFYLQFNFCPQYLKVKGRARGLGPEERAIVWGFPFQSQILGLTSKAPLK